jgi:hypothetical protein
MRWQAVESRCAGAGATEQKHGFVACIVAAWKESRCAGAGGATEQRHGFVACIVAWVRPRCAVGAASDAASCRVRIAWRRLRPRRRTAVTHTEAERESASAALGVGFAAGSCRDSSSARRDASHVAGDVGREAADVIGGLGAKPPYSAEARARRALPGGSPRAVPKRPRAAGERFVRRQPTRAPARCAARRSAARTR